MQTKDNSTDKKYPIESNRDNKERSWRLFKDICIGCEVLGVVSMYTLGALSFGANPLKPQDYLQKRREFFEQRKTQKEQKVRDDSKKEFYDADKNKDSVLDPNEFYDYYRGGRISELESCPILLWKTNV